MGTWVTGKPGSRELGAWRAGEVRGNDECRLGADVHWTGVGASCHKRHRVSPRCHGRAGDEAGDWAGANRVRAESPRKALLLRSRWNAKVNVASSSTYRRCIGSALSLPSKSARVCVRQRNGLRGGERCFPVCSSPYGLSSHDGPDRRDKDVRLYISSTSPQRSSIFVFYHDHLLSTLLSLVRDVRPYVRAVQRNY